MAGVSGRMKLYADIVFKTENGIVVDRQIQEETKQYPWFNGTVHQFFFDWKVGVSNDAIEVMKND